MLNFRKPIIEGMSPIKLIYFLTAGDALIMTINHLNEGVLSPRPFDSLPITLGFFNFLNVPLLAALLLILNFILPPICFVYSHKQFWRVLNFMLFFLSKGLIFSLNRFSHVYWPLLWTLMLFAIPKKLDEKSIEQDPIAKNCYRMSIVAACSFYFFPGLWKVFEGLQSGDLLRLDYAANTVAFYLLNHGKQSLLGDFAIQQAAVSYAGFMAIIILQISSVCCIFSKSFLRIWPILILCFHAMSFLVLQVNFFLAGIVCSILMMACSSEIVIDLKNIARDRR